MIENDPPLEPHYHENKIKPTTTSMPTIHQITLLLYKCESSQIALGTIVQCSSVITAHLHYVTVLLTIYIINLLDHK